MKYALAFAGLVAGALAGGECYAPLKPHEPSHHAPPPPPADATTYYAPPEPHEPSHAPPKPYEPSHAPPKPHEPSYYAPPPADHTTYYAPPKPHEPSHAPPKPHEPSYYAPPPADHTTYYAPPKPHEPSHAPPKPYEPSHAPPKPHEPSHYALPPSTPTPAPGPGYFGVISSRSASPIHLQPLTAHGGKFYLGDGPPSSYCPESVGSACPPGDTTVFAGGDRALSLGVVVPGGQQVYVAADGALSYTTAHSAYIPAGSDVDQFSKSAPSNSNSFGYLNFDTGFVACPVGDAGNGYQVYGQVQGFKARPECLGFSALTSEVDQPGAWQY